MKSLEDKEDAHQLIYFDLDNLQLVNDTFTRHAGDELIIRFAQLLEEQRPHGGALANIGRKFGRMFGKKR